MQHLELDDLVCTLCFHFFDDNEHIPRMLPSCGHTFCSRCLQNIIDNLKNDEIFACPDDKVKWPLSKKDISSFPKNFVIIRLIEKRKLQKLSTKSENLTANNITGKKFIFKEESSPKNHNNNSMGSTGLTYLRSSSIEDDQRRETIMLNDNNHNHNKDMLNHSIVSHAARSTSDTLSPNSTKLNIPPSNIITIATSSTKAISSPITATSTTTPTPTTAINDFNICKDHLRKLEIVCMDHKCRICTNCALFGVHKNHEIKAEEEVLKEISNRADSLVDMISLIDEIHNNNSSNDEYHIQQLYNKLRTTYDHALSIVQDKFNKYIEIIRIREKKIIDEINTKFSMIEEKINEIKNLPNDLENKISSWKNVAQEKLNNLCQKTRNSDICFDFLEDPCNVKNDILTIGNKLIEELEQMNNLPIKSYENALNNIQIMFNDDNIESIINELCIVIFNTDNLIETNKSSSSLLLPKSSPKSSSYTQQNLKINTNLLQHHGLLSANLTPTASTSTSAILTTNIPYKIPVNTNTKSKLTQLIMNRSNYKNTRDLSKNKKSIEIFNEKIQRMAEEGQLSKLDKLDKIDYGNKSFPNHKLDDEHDLLSMELSHFPLADIPDFSRTNSGRTLIIPTSNEMISTPNSLSQKSNGNKPTSFYFPVAESNKDIKTKLNNTTIISSPTIKIIDKEGLVNKLFIKKRASMKFFEKIEAEIDNLKQGNTDVIDLTGAEIGDIGVSYLSEYISNNKQMKHLKLIRNKITDEGGYILLKSLERNNTIHTLNLTQNLLTEKTIEGFLSLFKINNTIKNIYFNQNSVCLRNAKNKIKEISRLGINVNI